jgi:hypothetical protein
MMSPDIPPSVQMIKSFMPCSLLTAVNFSTQGNLVQLQGFGECGDGD